MPPISRVETILGPFVIKIADLVFRCWYLLGWLPVRVDLVDSLHPDLSGSF